MIHIPYGIFPSYYHPILSHLSPTYLHISHENPSISHSLWLSFHPIEIFIRWTVIIPSSFPSETSHDFYGYPIPLSSQCDCRNCFHIMVIKYPMKSHCRYISHWNHPRLYGIRFIWFILSHELAGLILCIWRFPKIGVPKNEWLIRGNPI